MLAAAEDLDVTLKTYYAAGNRYQSYELAKQAIHEQEKPDFLLYIYQHGSGSAILEYAEQHAVKSFIFNTSISPDVAERIQQPRQKFRHWIGHMYPNDRAAGRLLGEALLEQERAQRAPESKDTIPLIAISGNQESAAGPQRSEGLQNLIAETEDAILHRLVYAQWQPQLAAKQARILLESYPDTRIIWSASDAMALGIIKELRRIRWPRPWPLVGGIDWTTAGIDAVVNGEMAATVGGHFMEGGWALLLLHDYYYGFDFEEFVTVKALPMHVIDRNNAEAYRALLSQDFGHIDFRRFSRRYQENWQAYPFMSRSLRQQLHLLLEP